MIADRSLLPLLALGAAALLLSACGGGGGVTTTPAPAPQPFAYMFGNGFGADFTSTNVLPAPLSGNEINPVSLTSAPIPFPASSNGTN